MEQRRRRRTTDPAEAAQCLATALREIAAFAEDIGHPDPRRMDNDLSRLWHQLGNMSGIVHDYKTVIENHQKWDEPLAWDVWGEDEREVERAEDSVGS